MRMSLQEKEEYARRVDGVQEDTQGMDDGSKKNEGASCRVYDVEGGNVDFSKKKVTDMSNWRRIKVPDAAEVKKEATLQVLVNNLEDVAVKAERKGKSCLKDVVSTLSDQQKLGKERLLKREDDGEIILVASDKSGKLIPMSPTLYSRQAMQPHIHNDTVHSREDVNKAEKLFNGASRHILRAFQFGEGWGHGDGFQQAGKSENNEVPDLNQLVKDHKSTLKTRPFCRAQVNQAPNGPLAEILCEILNPFVEEADKQRRTEVRSTEEICV